MEHYVICRDYVTSQYTSQGNIDIFNGTDVIAVAHSPEEAERIFAEKVAEAKQEIAGDDWTTFVDTPREFSVGKDVLGKSVRANWFVREI